MATTSGTGLTDGSGSTNDSGWADGSSERPRRCSHVPSPPIIRPRNPITRETLHERVAAVSKRYGVDPSTGTRLSSTAENMWDHDVQIAQIEARRIRSLAAAVKRLDEAAHSIRAAQKKALAEGTTIPFDPDGIVTLTGRPLPLSDLRGRLLVNADFQTENVRVNRDRLRVNIMIPVLTLLGEKNIPALIEGTTPVHADVARDWAAGSDEWFRILTDPVTGRVLDVPPERYVPTRQMLELLRLRNPVCAAPGCTSRTDAHSEADHIKEFNHESPEQGGRTNLDNLHLLCIQHHQLKTERLIDPVRVEPGSGPPGFDSASESPAVAYTDWDFGDGLIVRSYETGYLLATQLIRRYDLAHEARMRARERAKNPILYCGQDFVDAAVDAGEFGDDPGPPPF